MKDGSCNPAQPGWIVVVSLVAGYRTNRNAVMENGDAIVQLVGKVNKKGRVTELVDPYTGRITRLQPRTPGMEWIKLGISQTNIASMDGSSAWRLRRVLDRMNGGSVVFPCEPHGRYTKALNVLCFAARTSHALARRKDIVSKRLEVKKRVMNEVVAALTRMEF